MGSALLGIARGVPLPAIHDEFSYLLAAETFVEGRLANPTHPQWTHFETFHVIHEPSYASKYPPGQGLLLALGQTLGGHPAVGLWIGAGLMAAAVGWALLVWLPPSWAMLAGAVLVGNIAWFSYWSQSYWGGSVAALGGALAFGALRGLWDKPGAVYGTVLGLGLGILAISRPFEGAVAGSVIAVALCVRMVRHRNRADRLRLMATAAGTAVALALSLGWMAYYNLRVTGSPLTMPYQVDNARYAAAPALLVQSPPPMPDYTHTEMERFWSEWGLQRYERQRQPDVFAANVVVKTTRFLLFFLGPGIVALVGLGRAPDRPWLGLALGGIGMVVGIALLTAGSYMHYIAPVTFLFYALLGAGLCGLHRRSRSLGRWNFALAVSAAFAIVIPVQMVQFLSEGQSSFAVERHQLEEQLARMPGRHLVVVDYDHEHNYHREWVYNRANIDDSPVVWARSMGPELDQELIEHFGDRTVWALSVGRQAHLTQYGRGSQ